MQRSLASIQQIKKLEPIPNADNIEKATVLGWQCVVQKGSFKEGDLIVYCEVDSFLPVDNPDFEFLRKSCYRKFSTGEEGFRIKTIKLRGQISQGICFPLTVIATFENCNPQETVIEGSDVTELLKIKKYEPPIPAELAGKVKGQFPSFIPKTDEIRIQAVPNVLERHKDKFFYCTEKLDGASVTYYIKDGEFGVCSRNLELLETSDNTLWKIAREMKIEEKLKSLNVNIAFQGECIGSGIQKNPYKLKNQEVRFYNIFDIDKYQYLSYEEMLSLLDSLMLKMVPFVSTFKLNHSIEDLINMSKGKSILSETIKEGLVFRPMKEDKDEELGRLSFKCINPEYLLKYEE